MILTPVLGAYLDRKGKGATMLMLGAILMIVCHLIFAITPAAYFTKGVAYSAIVILGVSFPLFQQLFGHLYQNLLRTAI
jgi:dipeptide/tripeptide permease